MFNVKGLNNMSIIPEVISPSAEIPKEDIYNKRIYLEDFPIFSKPNPLDVVIGFLENCHACVILAASKTTSEKKRNISNKHSERMAKKFKTAKENLGTSAEESKVVGATSAGTTYGKSVPSEAHSLFVDTRSSILSTTLTSPTFIPHIYEPVHFLPLTSPQTTNPNVTIPPPSPSHSEILTSILIPTHQPLFPLSLLSNSLN